MSPSTDPESRDAVPSVPVAHLPSATGGVHVRLLDPGDPDWPAFLAQCAHDVYHAPEYVRIEARHERGRPCALLIEDGERGLLLPLIIRHAGGLGVDATSPYGYSSPLVRGTTDPRFVADALRKGARVLREMDVIALFVRWHPILGPEPPGDFGTLVRHGDTVAVDLTLPIDRLRAQMRRNHRDQIRQARSAGYVAEWHSSPAGLAAFQRLYTRTMERVSADGYHLFDADYFAGLVGGLGERLRLAFVQVDGEVVAGGVFTESCSGIVEAHLTASDGLSASTCARATKLMFDFVIERSQASDQRWLHLGGGRNAEADSLFHFKAGFSPLRFPFYTTRVIIRPVEYARLVAERASVSDPEDQTGYFPAYRRPSHEHALAT